MENYQQLVYLYHYYDLSEDAREHAFRVYGIDWDAANFYLQTEYEDVFESVKQFESMTGASLKFESVHGPGTEEFFPGDVSCYTGYGIPREFDTFENVCMWSDYLIIDAWNKYVPAMRYLFRRLYDESGMCSYSWYEEQYESLIERALQSVCDSLNKAMQASEEYTLTREFFEDELFERDTDTEWFFTESGDWYARDEGNGIVSDDTFDDLEVLYQGIDSKKRHVTVVLPAC